MHPIVCTFLYTSQEDNSFWSTNKLLAAIELPHLHNSPVQSAWGAQRRVLCATRTI